MVSSAETKSSLTSCAEDNSSLRIIEISSDSENDVLRKPQHSESGSTSHGENGHHNSCPAWGNDVIELTDSDSNDSADLPDVLSPLIKGPRRRKTLTSTRPRPPSEKFVPLYSDTSDDEGSDEDCILVLNDPPSSRKPVRRIPPVKGRDANTPPLCDSPKKNAVRDSSQLAKSSSKRGKHSALKAKEQARLQKYATDLFAQLNKDVFDDLLPKDTTLEWSKRLLTTAGRARWDRSCEGVHTTKIELASKILDCEERIRNTLSHEMCHLACWVIDNRPQEGHGQLFKSWANKVMSEHPDIDISTRHNYEISYPYEWRCEKCTKVYGRYSKSIRPDACVCGACKVGKLIPLFVERKQPTTPKISRMAIDRPRDFPCLVNGSPTETSLIIQRAPVSIVDGDVLDLVNTFGGISINDTRIS